MDMVRDQLSQVMDMVQATLMSTRADLTTMALMATTSTIPMARDQLNLDTMALVMDMESPTPTNMCQDPTPTMELMSTIPTRYHQQQCQIEIVRKILSIPHHASQINNSSKSIHIKLTLL